MKSEYTTDQLRVIQKIAQIQIDNLLELQKSPEVLHQRIEESRQRGFDEITISDYYEDIAESWEVWENILENPENFLVQRYFHNYAHIQFILENSFTPMTHEQRAWEGLIKKIVIARTVVVNQN